MKVFFIVLWIIFLFNLIARKRRAATKVREEELQQIVNEIKNTKACPPHKWSWIEGRGHYCTLCKFWAGTHKTNGGDY